MSVARSLGELRHSSFTAQRLGSRRVKDELRENLMARLRDGSSIFPGIVGYDDTVVPQIVNAILSRHNFILLGLRGQAKSRILRALTALLDPQMPYVAGCEIHDNPYAPICRRCRELVVQEGDATPIAWLMPEHRYVEKLATPDVTIADLIGEIDLVKHAQGRYLSDESTMHFGLIPRTNRGIFAINELPDLAPKIQVGLFNTKERSILEGVLGLAAAFSRQSLVEGVESAEHGLAVLRMGCELAQGYGIAYPMPAAELAQWVAEWRPDPRWAQVALEGKEVHPLLRAESEHLAWMVSLENFLKGDCPTAPQLGRHQCKLGTWLDAENVAGRGSQPEFQAIVALHWRIHALATGVLKLKAQSRAEEALNRIGEMAGLLDRMFEHLRALKPII